MTNYYDKAIQLDWKNEYQNLCLKNKWTLDGFEYFNVRKANIFDIEIWGLYVINEAVLAVVVTMAKSAWNSWSRFDQEFNIYQNIKGNKIKA